MGEITSLIDIQHFMSPELPLFIKNFQNIPRPAGTMFIITAIVDITLKISRNLLFYFLIFTISGSLIAVYDLSPIKTSAFFHEKLFDFLSPSSSENGFSTHQDYLKGFTMEYPSNWERGELESGDILFTPPEGNARIVVAANFIDSPSGVDEEDDVRLVLADWKRQDVERYSSNKTLGFKLLESNMTTLDGNIASRLVYLDRFQGSEQEWKWTQLNTIKGDTVYSVFTGADAGTYNDYAPTFQKLIDLIKIWAPG